MERGRGVFQTEDLVDSGTYTPLTATAQITV